MEYVDLYVPEFIKTGEVLPRGAKITGNKAAMIIFICIFNKEGKMLIQRRSMNKVFGGGMWDVSAGGAVQSGESSEEAALRETEEELGLQLKQGDAVKLLSLYHDHYLHDIYTAVLDIELSDLQLQKEEVMDARFVTADEIFQMMDRGEFFKVHKGFIQLVFEMKTRQGLLL